MSDANEQNTLPPGSVFGRYVITRVIGVGGMGAVYEAQHNDLKKRVALKTLHQSFADHDEIKARFMREGESASRIRHPHIVDVTDFGVQDSTPFLVMEFLEGESLGDLLERERRLSVERLVDIMLPVCAGIAAAHDEGVIHRDLKPDNLFLARGRKGEVTPKVVDFGISKVNDGAQPSSLTSTGSMLGTPFYMSPEQLRTAKNIDHRIDQYALGVIMYECVTGERPFMAETLYEMMHKIATGDFAPPRHLRGELPEAFEQVILRAMARTPEDRYPSVRGLAAALLPFASPKARVVWEEEFASAASGAPPSVSSSVGAAVSGASHAGSSGLLSASQLFQDVETPAAPASPPVLPGSVTGTYEAISASTLANTGREIDLPFAPPPAEPAKRSPALLAAIAVAVLGVGGGAALFLSRGSSANANANATPSAAASVAVSAAPSAAASAQQFTASLAVTPPHAVIELDGAPVGAGTFSRAFPVDGQTHSLRVSAPGFVPREFSFRDAPPAESAVQLAPLPGVVVLPSGMAFPSGMMVMPTALAPVATAAPSEPRHNGGPRPRATAAAAANGGTNAAQPTAAARVNTGANGAAIIQ